MDILVIGAGAAGNIHVGELVRRGCTVGVHDTLPEKAEALAARHGARAVVDTVGDWQAVVVAVPAANHYAVIMEHLQAGRQVVSEKPLALTAEQARQLAGAATSRQLYIAESQCYAGADGLDVQRMRSRIASGEFGDAVQWRVCAMTKWRPQPWCDDLYFGGGAFLEGGSHVLTTARVLFGDAVRWQGSVRCLSGGTGPDSGAFIVDYERGDQLLLSIGWGTEGCFEGECEPLANSFGLIGARRCEEWWPSDDHAAMWGHLLKCLAGEAGPVATVHDAAGAVEDCWRCYETAGISS